MDFRQRAYSLLEVLLAMGLIALLSGLIVSNTDSLFNGVGDEEIDESLFKVVREARYQAAFTKDVVLLSFDEEQKAFRIFSENGVELFNYPIIIDSEDWLRFYSLLPMNAEDISYRRQDREEIQFIRFHPDRSSTVFEVDVHVYGETETHRYDPFSNLKLPRKDED